MLRQALRRRPDDSSPGRPDPAHPGLVRGRAGSARGRASATSTRPRCWPPAIRARRHHQRAARAAPAAARARRRRRSPTSARDPAPVDGQPIEQVRALLHQGVAEKDLPPVPGRRGVLPAVGRAGQGAPARDPGRQGHQQPRASWPALRGDLPLAIARFDEAAEIFRETDPILRAITVVDSGYALTQAGLFSEAVTDLLDRGRAARRRRAAAAGGRGLALPGRARPDRGAGGGRHPLRPQGPARLPSARFDGGELMARAVLAATATVTRRTIARSGSAPTRWRPTWPTGG